jgi:hypothetical protein
LKKNSLRREKIATDCNTRETWCNGAVEFDFVVVVVMVIVALGLTFIRRNYKNYSEPR